MTPRNNPAATSSAKAGHAARDILASGKRNTNVTPLIPRLRTTSLSELIKDKEKKTTASPDVQTEAANQDFTQADLTKYWIEYANGLGLKKAHLKNTLLNCQPILGENFAFEVAVYNPIQKDEILEDNVDLLTYLRARLSHASIRMDIRIVEEEEKEMVYTAPEKYAYLNRKNPNLDKLKEAFNLTLE